MKDKRTAVQLEFDMAKHGWAFCNQAMLKGIVDRLEHIAKRLKPDDKRHEIMTKIRARIHP